MRKKRNLSEEEQFIEEDMAKQYMEIYATITKHERKRKERKLSEDRLKNVNLLKRKMEKTGIKFVLKKTVCARKDQLKKKNKLIRE